VLNAFRAVATKDINDSTDIKSKEKEAATTGITESLYDAADNVFSTVLAQFYPAHPRYSLEDEAILELTNQKIQAKYDALTPEQKSNYHQAYNKMKLQAEFRKTFTPKNDGTTDATATEEA
jgi:hypothetical protein